MASLREQSYRLLQNENENNTEESFYVPENSHGGFLKSSVKSTTFLGVFSILSAATNVLLAALIIFTNWGSWSTSPGFQPKYIDASPYAGLVHEPSFKFPYSTGYGPLEATNHTLADELWEAIDIDPGIVAVPLDWAEEHNLAETQPFPRDSSKGVYVVNAFHSIHCLKIIHRVVYDGHHGRPLSREVEHFMHYIDHMHKDAMCNADDFLLPTPPYRQGNPGPHGQSRICKNWDSLVTWAKENDACYQHITDDEVGFAENHSEIEGYLNCKPDSPYAQKM